MTRRTPSIIAGGVTIRSAIEQTGMSRRQLMLLIAAGKVRHSRAGKYWTIHQWDVAAIAASKWSGKAYEVPSK